MATISPRRGGRSPDDRAALIAKLEAAINAHLTNPRLTLTSVAHALGYSPRQLQRLLAAEGLGWQKLVLARRMDRAARLLSYGQRPRTVAPKVGYRPQHLSEAFRRHTGLVPMEVYRAGQLLSQLSTMTKPFRPADLAAECRAVDRWTRLYDEAEWLRRKARSGTAAAKVLDDALAYVPPPRPVPHPRERQQSDLIRRFARETQTPVASTPGRQRHTAAASRARRSRGDTRPNEPTSA